MWLARGVTGALRAVKVVWREDFEDERGFEREFEGILKFEPISRDHPALVNILHVGRSPDGDVVLLLRDGTGRRRQAPGATSIRSNTSRARCARITSRRRACQWEPRIASMSACASPRRSHHLHEGGLAHRDVKPSNIIFVNGKAKLADIGLVAARGQRTFVGTEGFVPPEGPGSAQADVYSLGKVLYEIATGKDRMNFPELPDEMPDRHRPQTLAGTQPHHLRRLRTADFQTQDLHRRRTRRGAPAHPARQTPPPQRHWRWRSPSWCSTGFAGWAGWEVVKDTALGETMDRRAGHSGTQHRASCGFSALPKEPTCSMPTACWWAPRRPPR